MTKPDATEEDLTREMKALYEVYMRGPADTRFVIYQALKRGEALERARVCKELREWVEASIPRRKINIQQFAQNSVWAEMLAKLNKIEAA